MNTRRIVTIGLGLVAMLALAIGLRPPAEREPSAPAPAPAPSVVAATAHPSPLREDDEAKAALKRVFAGALVARRSGTVTGDFNGDGSPDLAVAATPSAAGLAQLGDQLANWIVCDLDAPRPSARQRVTFAAGDALIAIIHGYGAVGWRSPEARQAYLLARAPEALQVRASGNAVVIAGTRNGHKGFVRWTGSRYAWREDGIE